MASPRYCARISPLRVGTSSPFLSLKSVFVSALFTSSRASHANRSVFGSCKKAVGNEMAKCPSAGGVSELLFKVREGFDILLLGQSIKGQKGRCGVDNGAGEYSHDVTRNTSNNSSKKAMSLTSAPQPSSKNDTPVALKAADKRAAQDSLPAPQNARGPLGHPQSTASYDNMPASVSTSNRCTRPRSIHMPGLRVHRQPSCGSHDMRKLAEGQNETNISRDETTLSVFSSI
ncbi:hypothetical protein B0T10DRAFT_465955 [Thelonectria olida]|uniref:Uncharacterized protein n=1 Tax=Thelonectria olida TaxID=1576542 RepID=A0A9P8VT31_9HYPO|nr:hypothetical protein B0T10DRAFT_465955 [Thelonectria olida]